MIVYYDIIFDRSTWNHTKVGKLFVLDRNTWYHIAVCTPPKKKTQTTTQEI